MANTNRHLMRLGLVAVSLGFLFGGLSACKWAFLEQEVAREQGLTGEAVNEFEIRRVQESSEGSVPLTLDLDERGVPVAGLELQLDWFPPAKPGQATLPACLTPLEPQAEVGVWRCAGSAEAFKPLKAGMLTQVCDVVEGQRVKSPLTEQLMEPGCAQLAVYAHQFSPELRIVHALKP